MGQEEDKPRSRGDEELEREIWKDRSFSLAEAIGRLAGPDAMKGASPVARTRQAEAVIQNCLRANLSGDECLPVVMLRQVMTSEMLLRNLDQPLVVLADYVQRVLASGHLLSELVRETDVEWGRTYDERPHFEIEGSPAHPDDPYTPDSVRNALSALYLALGRAVPGESRP